jgi:hypothetical protein
VRTPWRRKRVPAGVREAIELIPGEQVLAVARSGQAAYLVATSSALVLVTTNTESEVDEFMPVWRVRWDQIDNARWSAPDLIMTTRVDDLDEGGLREIRTEVETGAELPAVVHDRVNDSILASEQIPVQGGSIRAVARRHGESGETIWRVIIGKGIDMNSPEVRRQAEEGLAVLRSRLGV